MDSGSKKRQPSGKLPATVLLSLCITAGIGISVLLAGIPAAGQGGYRAPRSAFADGWPDLNGVWQALTSANWDIEAHEAGSGYSQGPAWMLGALVAKPPGLGIVEGGRIPYRPEMAAKRQQNFDNRLVADVYKPEQGDPELKCFLPSPIRANYMPQPFQIIQTDKDISVAYQYGNADRIIHIAAHQKPAVDTWMGVSNGRWDGDTLVVDVSGLNGYSWFDRAGNFIAADTKLTERWTRVGPDHMQYEVTVENAAVYTRAWKMSVLLYRILEPRDAQILEFKCVPYSEEAMYGRYTKGWQPLMWDPLTQQPVRK